MTNRDLLRQEIDQLPESIADEVLDFLRFLKVRKVESGMRTAIATEPVLAKDWLREEENQAWRDL